MAKTFIECDQDTIDCGNSAMERFHGELRAAGVTCNYLFARNHDKAGEAKPALKHHGYPAGAVIKINSLKDRAEGKADVTITVDEYTWQERDDANKLALMDHEWEHIEVVTDPKTGNLKRDDLGRPKLRMRLHDFEGGFFFNVAERHKDHSAEVQALRSLSSQSWVQAAFNWG